MTTEERIEKLTEAVALLAQRGQQPAPQPAAPQAAFGLPQTQPTALGVYGGPQPGFAQPMQPGAMPQPTGVSVPVTIPMPDGRDLSVYVQFPAEAAANLQALAMAAAAMFGPYLRAYAPRSNSGGGNFRRRWY